MSNYVTVKMGNLICFPNLNSCNSNND